MESNLQYEDLLMKLRAKLNEEKIKLWELPYNAPDTEITLSLQELSTKYSSTLGTAPDLTIQALRELQLHSISRCKANTAFQETGVATFTVKASLPGQKPREIKVQKTLETVGRDLITVVAAETGVAESRIKLIFNGKVLKSTPTLQEQGLKNGAQIMALVMTETPEEVKQEDKMYLEMKTTRDDATLLSEYADDYADDEYMKLEDQSGKTVELPPAERRALMVGLALHERGRTAAKKKDFNLALVLFLEADRLFGECNSSLLQSVDNWAVLQLDISWSYLRLQSLKTAADAATRLQAAERALKNSYGERHSRVEALKGTAANERVVIMRLYLLQGIVAYHQNRREEARKLLEKAETELSTLRVDEDAVEALMALGWSSGQARTGLRATAGDRDRAHHYLEEKKKEREEAREQHRMLRQSRLLGTCADGSPVNLTLVQALEGMGFSRRLATLALRNSNNNVTDAVRLIQEEPELLADSDLSSSDARSSFSSEDSLEPDRMLVAELEAMGYDVDLAKRALRMARNHVTAAVDMLLKGEVKERDDDADNPSTSAGTAPKRKQKRQKSEKREKRRKEREAAFKRLSSAIRHEEDDHLDSSLVEEEEFLAQYKSLL